MSIQNLTNAAKVHIQEIHKRDIDIEEKKARSFIIMGAIVDYLKRMSEKEEQCLTKED